MFALKVFIVTVFCVIANVQATPFQVCPGKPKPEALRVKGCDKEPCQFVRGSNVEAEWDFTVVAKTDNLRPVVKARALGVTVDYPLPQQDACLSLTNGECPLDANESVTYGLNMPILKAYPKVKVHLTFSLVDSNDNVHACFQLDAQVVGK